VHEGGFEAAFGSPIERSEADLFFADLHGLRPPRRLAASPRPTILRQSSRVPTVPPPAPQESIELSGWDAELAGVAIQDVAADSKSGPVMTLKDPGFARELDESAEDAELLLFPDYESDADGWHPPEDIEGDDVGERAAEPCVDVESAARGDHEDASIPGEQALFAEDMDDEARSADGLLDDDPLDLDPEYNSNDDTVPTSSCFPVRRATTPA